MSTALPIQVHRHDRLGPRRDTGLGALQVHQQRLGIDFAEHRASADHADGADGRNGRVGDRDHFVAGTDLQRAQGDGQRVGAVADAHGVAFDVPRYRAKSCSKAATRGPSTSEPLARTRVDRRQNFVANRRVLLDVVEHADRRVRRRHCQ